MVQSLRGPWTFTAEGRGSIPGWGTNSHKTLGAAKRKNTKLESRKQDRNISMTLLNEEHTSIGCKSYIKI